MTERVVLQRRLDRLRAARGSGVASGPSGPDHAAIPVAQRPAAPALPRAGVRASGGPLSAPPARLRTRGLLGERLAARLGGELVRTGDVAVVRVESGSQPLPVDRGRLASLPGQPPPDVPLVCLDTETTGLGTAAGTLVFLVGLGWWEDERFRQAQLLLPDHADEPALLAALAAFVPAGAWLVTYNGRSFDWPLLETRYRLRRHAPPEVAGHLDLLPIARRFFRHRLPDARLRTVERQVLGMTRYGDVDGALIPGRYLEALRLGDPEGLVDVVRHNDLDVLALARLLAHLDAALGDETARRSAHPGDLAGLGRAFRRAGRLDEALDCLDAALAAGSSLRPEARPAEPSAEPADGDDDPGRPPWWSPRARADIGGRPALRPPLDTAPLVASWTQERVLVERARILRRLGRAGDAAETWEGLAAGSGRLAAIAAIELAKLQEHAFHDPRAAIGSLERAWRVLDRRRRLAMPEPVLEADLQRRGVRLRRALRRTAA